MYYGLQGLNRSTGKRGGESLCNLAVTNGVLFPNNATQILTAVLEIRFDEDLEAPLMGDVNI